MRVISMVPSWTETLIESGVEVVGRTRFCIHPRDRVREIAAVGGTKDIHWDKVQQLRADLLILDQEENPKSMAEESPIPYFVSHVRSIGDVSRDLFLLAQTLPQVRGWAEQWRGVSLVTPVRRELGDLPVLEWIRKPGPRVEKFVYLIWRNPWMAVSRNTFIGSMWEHLGLGSAMYDFSEPYPKVALESFDPETTMLLFSTEPFPFAKKKVELATLPFASALVDGESLSWFGVRSLRFLKSQVGLTSF